VFYKNEKGSMVGESGLRCYYELYGWVAHPFVRNVKRHMHSPQR